MAFSADGARMAVAGRNGQIRVWNVTSGAHERDIDTDGRRIRALAFSPDGTRLAAAGNSPQIHVFDVASGQPVMTLDVAAGQGLSRWCSSTTSGWPRAAPTTCIRIWDLDSRAVTTELVGHTGTVAALACDAAGTMLVSGSYDTTLRVWNLADAARAGHGLRADRQMRPASGCSRNLIRQT